MEQILLHVGLGLLGIVLYTLFKSKDYIFNHEFVWSTMISENLKAWIWSFLVILTLAIAIKVEPNIKDAIKSIFSIDLNASPSGFFIFGATINLMIKPNKTVAKRRKTKE